MNKQNTDLKPLKPQEPIAKNIKEISKKKPEIKEKKKK